MSTGEKSVNTSEQTQFSTGFNLDSSTRGSIKCIVDYRFAEDGAILIYRSTHTSRNVFCINGLPVNQVVEISTKLVAVAKCIRRRS